MVRGILLLLSIVFCIHVSAQYDHSPVFPDLEGDDLRIALESNYKPDTVLSLSQARDTVYKVIYLEDDSVSCVYSGWKRYLDPSADPSQYLFNNGGNLDINLEHGFPRSKGADQGNPSSDMHHLFPTRVSINSARGSDPYGEIADSNADTWYYKNITTSLIPDSNIELYSEDNNSTFEPREDFKGNVARAYFYFYTMYQSEADSADDDFFDSQRVTLCDWHFADPVDSLEWLRTYRIADYQSGVPNPFVLDCSLARLYCPQLSSDCQTVDTEDIQPTIYFLYPNLVNAGFPVTIEFAESSAAEYEVKIFDIAGRIIQSDVRPLAFNKLEFEAPSHKGIYLIHIMQDYKLQGITRLIVI